MTDFRRARYVGALRLAQAVVFWERFWPALWPVVGLIGVFLGIALLDVLPALPSWLHAAVLLAVGVALTAAMISAGRKICPVTREHARRRVERDSGLPHQPLAALEDTLATGAEDPQSKALWQEHVRRAERAVRKTTVNLPAPEMARREPWGIRAGVVLLLFIGLVSGGGDIAERLQRAVSVSVGHAASVPTVIDVWVTPAAYTRLSPVYRSANEATASTDDAIVAPMGSEVLVRVSGVARAPRVAIGATAIPMDAIESGNGPRVYATTATIVEGDRLAIETSSDTLASWPLQVIPDNAPEIGFANPPVPAGNGLLRVIYTATDDFGVRDVLLEIYPADGEPPIARKPTILAPLSLPAIDATRVSNSELLDFAAHQLAGTRVVLRLAAVDARSQSGFGPVFEMLLPERTFEHPVAQAIIVARRNLVDDSADIRRRVADMLADIAARPDQFAHSTVVTLALSVAKARLILDQDSTALSSVRHLLWETALGLEQGTVAAAERDLRDARQQLWEALRNDAPAEEIDRLIDELQAALDRFMNAVAAEMARRGPTEPALPQGTEQIHTSDLRELIEMARDLARTGARKDARQLLAQLQRILDQIRVGLDSGGDGKRLVEAHKIMQALRGLAETQQELLDETFESLRALPQQRGDGQGQGGPGAEMSLSREGEAERQEALRHRLGDLMLRLDDFTGGIPAPLGDAERSMRRSTSALRGNRLDDAVSNQTDAVDALQRAEQSAAQSMAEQLGGSAGLFAGDPDDDDGDGRDAFGRSRGGGYRGFGAGPIQIPDQPAVHRAQEILKELQRRAGDRKRPAVERDYIDRLLDTF